MRGVTYDNALALGRSFLGAIAGPSSAPAAKATPVIWVEILGRHGEVVARHRCDGVETRIGRGYDNDVVLDDPTVAPHHLRVFRGDDGQLVAEDAGSANGRLRGRRGAHAARVVVDGDRPLRIGRTLVRIREADHAVAPERRAVPVVASWPRALALAVAVIALETFLAWLGETTERKVSRYVLPLGAMLAFLTLAWTAAWAILTRIFAGHARFERHLVIALSALLVFSLVRRVRRQGRVRVLVARARRLCVRRRWMLLATLCYFHLARDRAGTPSAQGGGRVRSRRSRQSRRRRSLSPS